MRLDIRIITLLTLLVTVAVLSGCGGGSDEATPSSTSVAKATSQAQPSVVATTPLSTSAPATTVASTGSTGSVLEKATRLSWYELDNVRYGGTYRYMDTDTPASLEPKIFSEAGGMAADGRWFYEKLAGWAPNKDNEEAHLEPLLAESWSSSTDLKSYTFKLRKGVKWHNLAPVNGREMVADDVAYSFSRYREKDAAASPFFSQITSVETPDKYTITINISEPNAWLPGDISGRAYYIVAKELVDQLGGTLKETAIGTGAYILKNWGVRRGGLAVRNPEYWQKDAKGNRLPYTDAVEWVWVPDPATRVAAMRTGQVDFVRGLNADTYVALAKSIPDMRLFRLGLAGGSAIAFNTKKAPWNDVRVRRAFGMALDRKALGDQVVGAGRWGYGVPIPWSLVSDEAFTPEKLGLYNQFNPEGAKKQLIDAGFADGKLKVESPLKFQNPGNAQLTQVFQQLYLKNGIQFDIEAEDTATHFTAYYTHAQKDLGFTYIVTNDYTLNWFAQNKFRAGAAQNTSFIEDSEVQRVLNEIRAINDPAKLRVDAKLLWDFDTLGVWNVWLVGGDTFYGTMPRLRNYVLRKGSEPGGGHFFYWLADAPRSSP